MNEEEEDAELLTARPDKEQMHEIYGKPLYHSTNTHLFCCYE